MLFSILPILFIRLKFRDLFDTNLPLFFAILSLMKEEKPKILVVDDEPAVLDLLVYNLSRANYTVITASDGRQALELARQAEPDLILLDLMLPWMDGLDVCRELRRTSRVPVIMVTARGEEVDRVVGLELGADDYIVKPFSVRELVARVRAVLRRSQDEDPAPGAEVLGGPGDLRLDAAQRTVTVGATPLALTKLEFDLLYTLLLNAGRVLTRERLLEQVWGYDFAGDARAVDSAVKRLRAELRAADPAADAIEAVRGLGYKYQRERA
jgi:two-component system alkaline phosphatase synthesis response regulator PhoP